MSSIAKLKVEGGDEAVETINRVQKSLDKLNKVQAKNRDATRLLDKATGGAVTKFQDLQKGVTQGIKGIGGLSKSFKGLKGAIAATGIGLLVVALGTIVAYWDDIKALVSGVTREQKDLLIVQQESVAETEKGFNLISQTTNLLKESGATEKDILGLKMQSTQETITALKAQLLTQKQVKKSQVDTAKRNKEILEGFVKMITLPLFVLLETIDSIGKALGKQFGLTEGLYGSLGNLIFDPEGVEEAGEKSIQETEDKLLELENRQSGFRQKIDSINKAADKKAEADAKTASDKAIAEEKKKQDALEKIRQGGIDTQDERRAEELKKIQDEYTQLLLDQEKYGGDRQALLDAQATKERELRNKFKEEDKAKEDADLLLEQEKIIEKLELDKEFEELNFEEQRAILSERSQALLNDKTLSEEQRLKLSEQFADAGVKVTELEAKQKEEATMSYAKALSGIGSILGAETQAGKLAASAGALIATYLNANKARESQLAIATPDAPIRAALAAGVEIVSGLANVKAINSVKVPKASGGGGSSAANRPAAPAVPPAFNIVGQSDTSQLSETIANQANEPVRAFVVSNDVTTAQSLERNIVQGATI